MNILKRQKGTIIMRNKSIRKRMSLVLVFALAICMSFTSISFAVTVGKPTITLSSPSIGAIVVKSSNVKTKNGYQIMYSKKKSFSGSKTVTVATEGSLNRTIKGLSGGTRYYVKVRAYRTISGKKKYGNWSAVKYITVKAYQTAYVKSWKINLEKGKTSTTKWKTDPVNYTAPYMAQVKVYGAIGPYTKSQWVKVGYKGNIRYTYVNVSKEKAIFTTKKSTFTYANYEKYCTNDWQKQLIRRAMDVYNNEKDIRYDNSHTSYKYGQGKRASLDCSNFVRYVYNYILKSDVMAATPEGQWEDAKKARDLNIDGARVLKARRVDINELEPGDVLFFDDDEYAGGNNLDKVDHAAVYIGNNEFIHSTNAFAGGVSGVKISPLSGKYRERFVAAGRFTLESK